MADCDHEALTFTMYPAGDDLVRPHIHVSGPAYARMGVATAALLRSDPDHVRVEGDGHRLTICSAYVYEHVERCGCCGCEVYELVETLPMLAPCLLDPEVRCALVHDVAEEAARQLGLDADVVVTEVGAPCPFDTDGDGDCPRCVHLGGCVRPDAQPPGAVGSLAVERSAQAPAREEQGGSDG